MKIGDKVKYSVDFLRSTGQYTGDMATASGIITELKTYGKGFTLAKIDWINADLPEKVNISNLRTIKQVQLDQ